MLLEKETIEAREEEEKRMLDLSDRTGTNFVYTPSYTPSVASEASPAQVPGVYLQ